MNPPLTMIPKIASGFIRKRLPRKTEVLAYYALSNGKSLHYTNADALLPYSNTEILDPKDVSYLNVFINAVLQPEHNYEVQKGLLTLKTRDVPLDGTAIIIQFVKLH
ncbi:DUF4183 domain-containing protein [Metabacillus sp. FJAT-52054]|uniref:DUF4183 domain-containing protein n=1 Tax=Metabacillus sediminis TaxID=3117746 RepID=A0ABZ2NK54_9BACI